MTKHTKGPWRIGDVGMTIFGPKSSQPAPVMIASLLPPTPRVNSEERKANAKLIAAAPDMLATLRAIAADCEDYLNDDLDMDAGELCQAFLNAINKVHDQATGSTFSSENPVDQYGEKV